MDEYSLYVGIVVGFLVGTVFGLILPALPHDLFTDVKVSPNWECFIWDSGKEIDPPPTEWYNKVCPNLSSYDTSERMHYQTPCSCYEYKHRGFFGGIGI